MTCPAVDGVHEDIDFVHAMEGVCDQSSIITAGQMTYPANDGVHEDVKLVHAMEG